MPAGRRWNSLEKQHTCVSCGCVFRYHVPSSHPMRWMNLQPKDVVATHPCPTCGLLQPDMVMWTKYLLPVFTLMTLLAIVLLGAVGSANKASASLGLIAQIGAGVFGLIALFQIGTALANPNSDLEANRALAQAEVEREKLEVVTPGSVEGEVRPPKTLSLLYFPAFVMLLAGPVAFGYAVLQIQGGKPQPGNPEVSPSMVVPGDQVAFTFRNVRTEGVTGKIWRGQPIIRIQNNRELGLPETLTGQGSDRQWGTSMKVPRGSDNRPLEVTIKFTIPKDSSLSGKTLRLAVTLPVTYPSLQGSKWQLGTKMFVDQTATLSDTLTIRIADTAAVAQLETAFHVGLAGGALSFAAGLWLTITATLLGKQGRPSEVISLPAAPAYDSTNNCLPLSVRTPEDDVVRAKVGPIDFRRRVGGGPSA